MKDFIRLFTNILTIVLLLFVVPVFVLTITAFLGQIDWRLDLTSHFRPWYSIVEAGALLLFIGLRKKKLVFITLLFLIVNTIPLVGLYLKSAVAGQPGTRFKLIQFNVCAPAKDYALFSRFLLQEKPRVVVMEECAERCIDHLKRDRVWQKYPYHFRKIPYRHRLVVLSQYPMRELPMPKLTADPAIALLGLNIDGQQITLLALHSTRPSSGKPYYKNQIAQFEQIGQVAARIRKPFLIVGDLNVSPWNYSFGLLLRKTHLRNSMNGFGFQPSFPTFMPHFERFPVFPLIPIDHVLVSDHFHVLNRYTGKKLQSDHLPVVVELGL